MQFSAAETQVKIYTTIAHFVSERKKNFTKKKVNQINSRS